MKIRIPYPLTNDITATLSLQITVGKEMQLQAARNGYDPDVLQNLIAQKTQEVAQAIADCLGLPYDSEPE
jgi:hypothetical protein